MQILYTRENETRLKTYVDPARNTHEFEREEAELIAQRIADRGGYARVIFGSNTVFEAGLDPR